MSNTFKVGQLVICTDDSGFGTNNNPPRKGDVREVTRVSATGIFLELLGSQGTWSAKYFEPYDGLKEPLFKFKIGDRVRVTKQHNQLLNGSWMIYKVGREGIVTSFCSTSGWVRLDGSNCGAPPNYFTKPVSTIQAGDKGTIEVTVTKVLDNSIMATTGDYDEWCVRKENFTVTERAKPPKPKRERPSVNEVIAHGEKRWKVVNHLSRGGWFTVRELYTDHNFKLLHKNDPSWSN